MTVPIEKTRIAEGVLEICECLNRAGHKAWIVGGCLRDLLRGAEVNDWDVATSARPEDVQRVFRRVIPTGIQHGTVTVVWKNKSYEVTTLRGETTYSDGRRPDEVFFVTDITEDLARRDFTVNAIAFDPVHDAVVDPYDGIGDLERRIIRAVGRPEERFLEDGLRVLRAARFVANLEFDLEEATEAAIPQALGTYRKVSAERVRDEWLKTMKARSPSRAFEVMRRTGILSVTAPELLEQVGCEQNRHHAYDVWEHTMRCLDAMEGSPIERIAALLHDLGKPRSRARSEKTNDYTFHNHDVIGARMADRLLRTYRFSNQERETVTHLIRHHLVCYTRAWSDAAVRRFVKRVEKEFVDPLLRLARADALAKGRPVDEDLAALAELEARIEDLLRAGAALSSKDLAVTGKDVMEHLAIPPGRKVGEILDALVERVLDDPASNERERLLGIAREIAGDDSA